MNLWKKFLLVLACTLAVAPFASGQLTIVPTFDDSSLTGQNKTDFEATIDSAIQAYASLITNSVTVSITFKPDESVGLGQSQTFETFISYSRFLTDLSAHATTANDATALAHLPVQSANPVDGSTQMELSLANLRALGETSLATNNTGQPDAIISLKTSIMNLTRTGTPDGSKYDLLATTEHEIDEVLGFGSALNGLANGAATPTGPISPLDLFRYTSTGSRSFTTDINANAYFSIDSTTLLTRYNQIAPGDYQDFNAGGQPQVQDAFATPGAQANLGTNEKTGLDVIGYTLSAIPEPSTTALAFGAAMLGLTAALKRRRASV